MIILGPILSFFATAIGRYVLIGAISAIAIGWIRYEIRAPLNAEISALKDAAKTKEAITEADVIRADIAEAELAEKQSQFESLLHDTDKATACTLSAVDRVRLQQLADGKKRTR